MTPGKIGQAVYVVNRLPSHRIVIAVLALNSDLFDPT
jgi:hypothetical protein